MPDLPPDRDASAGDPDGDDASADGGGRRGTVVDFDEYVGLGEIEDAAGRRYLFHCVEIADGTRAIEVGTAVEFEVMVKFGAEEASQLRPAP